MHTYMCKSKSKPNKQELLLAAFGENRGVSKQNQFFCHEMLHTERSILQSFLAIQKSIAGQNIRHFLRTAIGTVALWGYYEGDPSH